MVNADDLLKWYDAQAREMPWRVPPAQAKAGKKPDPYHIWLSEVMLQQTTVAAVHKYFLAFTTRWPDVHALAHAKDSAVMGEWAGLGYYARARNLLKCARVVSKNMEGQFPDTEDALRALPGIGPYTAAAIAAIAFQRPATVVDANVERVMARIYAISTPLPDCKQTLRDFAATLTPKYRPGDYAQAVMDLGATLCGKKPACDACPWRHGCAAFSNGTAAELPKKRAKVAKPHRQGIAYFVCRADGAILLETRPEKGLLGGMLCLPCSTWQIETPIESPPLKAEWQVINTPVNHVFTHFHLALTVHVAKVAQNAKPLRGNFVARVDPDALPSVMRKIYQLGILAIHDSKG
ncbi:MAG: A/G-specific adenine glycosylase [Paracoccaceae bacterium]